MTCGSGEQSRQVTCVGSGGMMLDEASCSSLHRPSDVRPCEMAACTQQISWHVGEWGLVSLTMTTHTHTHTHASTNIFPLINCSFGDDPLSPLPHQCSQSCGSGSRERHVICSDPDRNLYPAGRCSTHPKPPTVERCNTQPCYRQQGEQKLHDALHKVFCL